VSRPIGKIPELEAQLDNVAVKVNSINELRMI
jgi:hypothetical protein